MLALLFDNLDIQSKNFLHKIYTTSVLSKVLKMNSKEQLEIEKAIILDADNPLLKISSREGNNILIHNELEGYIFNCAKALSAISSAIEKIRISIIMLEKARVLLPENSPYNESEHIEYAIENYFIRSCSLYDRCLIFTGKIFHLGLSNESINHSLIVTNEHVTARNISKSLKSIGKLCREFSIERNNIIHHGRYDDESFMTVSAIHKANQLLAQEGVAAPYEKAVVDHFTEMAISEKLVDFNAHLNKIENAINEYYIAVLPIYYELKNKLKNSE